MRRLIFLILAVCVLLGGAYLWFFKRGETERLARGYKDPETPQVAADMLKRAIEKREYDMAAFYCTAAYAEQLKRGNEAAAELGKAIDNLAYQMKERGLTRDEVKLLFYVLDPFPKEVQITVSKESGDTAEATFVFTAPAMSGNQLNSGMWNLKNEIMQVYLRSARYTNVVTMVVPMKKEKDGWKFDFPTNERLQNHIAYLNKNYKNYVNPMETVTHEVKNDPTTKDNVTQRLKTLLEQAAKE